jgi:antirestriction protein ArdC
MSQGKEKFDIYQVVTDTVLDALDKDIMPWRKPWVARNGRGGDVVAMHQNLVSKRRYTGINPFLLEITALTRGYSSPYWLTYNQLKKKKGELLPGQAGNAGGPGPTLVIFWKVSTFEPKPGNRCTRCHQGKLNARRVCDKCKKEAPKRASSFTLRYYNVWNIEQTTLDAPAPAEPVEDEPEEPQVDPIAAADAILRDMPTPPRVNYGGNRAFYQPAFDRIGMPERNQFKSSESFYSTLFHEHVHATGHEDRVNRKDAFGHSFGSPEYAREELIAEMGAAMLCAIAGVENEIDQSVSYIRNWMSKADYEAALKNDKKLVVFAAARAQKAADYILGETQTQETEDAA